MRFKKNNTVKKTFFILLLCLTISLISKAETSTVTFSAEEDRTEETSMSKEGITIDISRNKYNNLPQGSFNKYSSGGEYYYLMGSGAIFTFTSSVGYITEIELTYRSVGSYNGIIKGTNGTKGNYDNSNSKSTWTCERTAKLNSVAITPRNGANDITSITITYERTITISSSKHATFWCDKAYRMPTGLTGHAISNATNEITYGQSYEAGTIVPANVPLLITGNAGSYTYTTVEEGGITPENNMLVCATGATVNDADTYFYKMSYRSSTDKTTGFYWDSEDGHSITVPYAKAFLAIPQTTSAGAKGYDLTDTTNGITLPNINKSQAEFGDTVYDINGKAHTYSTNLPKGIYINAKGEKVVKK